MLLLINGQKKVRHRLRDGRQRRPNTCTRKLLNQKKEKREKKKEKGLAQVVTKKTNTVEGEKSMNIHRVS